MRCSPFFAFRIRREQNQTETQQIEYNTKIKANHRKKKKNQKKTHQGYRGELAGLHETSKQKAQRMVLYARQLKQEREKSRQAFAQEMYNRQWRYVSLFLLFLLSHTTQTSSKLKQN